MNGYIERAFAADVVDPNAEGRWGKVRRKLGVPGLGIASDDAPGWDFLERLASSPGQFSMERHLDMKEYCEKLKQPDSQKPEVSLLEFLDQRQAERELKGT